MALYTEDGRDIRSCERWYRGVLDGQCSRDKDGEIPRSDPSFCRAVQQELPFNKDAGAAHATRSSEGQLLMRGARRRSSEQLTMGQQEIGE